MGKDLPITPQGLPFFGRSSGQLASSEVTPIPGATSG
jgi:hypothetical protein